MRKLSTLITTILLLAFWLTSCNFPGQTPANTPIPTDAGVPAPTDFAMPTPTQAGSTDATPPPVETPASLSGGGLPAPADLSGEVTLWFTYESEKAEYKAATEVLAKAKKKYPNLVIKTERVPTSEIFTHYRADLASGGGPDLFAASNEQLGNLVREGLILELGSQIGNALRGTSPKALQSMTVDGKLYGIPESFEAIVLYYRTSMVLNPPTTTDDLRSQVQKGVKLTLPLNTYHLFGWSGAFGGRLLDESGRCVADQGGWIDYLKFLLDLKAGGAIFEPNYTAATQTFTQGSVGQILDGPWTLVDYRNAIQQQLGAMVLPAGPAGPATPFVIVDGFFVNPKSKNIPAAVSLALFLANQGSAQVFVDKGGHIPVREDIYTEDLLLGVFKQAVGNGLVLPQTPEFNNYWKAFGDMFLAVLVNGVPPEQALADACAAMNTANGK